VEWKYLQGPTLEKFCKDIVRAVWEVTHFVSEIHHQNYRIKSLIIFVISAQTC